MAKSTDVQTFAALAGGATLAAGADALRLPDPATTAAPDLAVAILRSYAAKRSAILRRTPDAGEKDIASAFAASLNAASWRPFGPFIDPACRYRTGSKHAGQPFWNAATAGALVALATRTAPAPADK
jgi:hypothetical protein